LGVESLSEESETSELWANVSESLLDVWVWGVLLELCLRTPSWLAACSMGLDWREVTLAISASQHPW